MNEQQKHDSGDLAALLRGLSKEDRLQVQGVIAGMKLARKIAAMQTGTEQGAAAS